MLKCDTRNFTKHHECYKAQTMETLILFYSKCCNAFFNRVQIISNIIITVTQLLLYKQLIGKNTLIWSYH